MKKQTNIKKTDKKPKTPKHTISIDHPKNDEIISHRQHYAVRTTVSSGDGIVEISINNGEWQKCRSAAGHWWYDWHNIPEGKHVIVTRLRDEQKKTYFKKI